MNKPIDGSISNFNYRSYKKLGYEEWQSVFNPGNFRYPEKKYLNKILEHDWSRFNQLDFSDQNIEWVLLMKNFDEILKENSKGEEMYFTNANNIIDSYSDRFSKLKISGGNKHIFYMYTFNQEKGWEAILWGLREVINKAYYISIKEKSTLSCDCDLALKHKKDPDIQNLKNIGWINDQYYFPELYICKECNFKWITYAIDDDLGGSAWEKYAPGDEALVTYY